MCFLWTRTKPARPDVSQVSAPHEAPFKCRSAGEDECHLLGRFKEYQLAVTNSETGAWPRIKKALDIVELNRSISINIPPGTLVNILQDDRLRYVNLHDNLRARAILDYPPDWAAKRTGIDNLAFGGDGDS